ncbi:MAG TPA: hypothetical protein VFR99_03230 [Marmoricola sp.]|nr:hypothetical protein [Marmoricola sp.]
MLQPPSSGIAVIDDVLDEAVGRSRREDPVLARTGGPAGNAVLTAWVGLILLVLVVAELITLLNVTGLISWHVGIGIVLVGLALLKTATTSWRILRYYTGTPTYVTAGPPPTLLRLLGPLVIVSTLGVLGSGIVLVAVGPERSRSPFLSVLGQEANLVTVHQGIFILFAVFAGVHLLARFVPALALAGGPRVSSRLGHTGGSGSGSTPGAVARWAVLGLVLVASVLAAVLVIPAAQGWNDPWAGHGWEQSSDG